MKLIVCIDDNGGMLFNNRRQSSDQKVIERIMKLTEHNTLYMNPYSSTLFSQYENICISDDFLQQADVSDYCFLENKDPMPYLSKCEEVVLFYWNRLYPSDFKFPIAVIKESWTLVHQEQFTGRSHDKLTMEVYRQ